MCILVVLGGDANGELSLFLDGNFFPAFFFLEGFFLPPFFGYNFFFRMAERKKTIAILKKRQRSLSLSQPSQNEPFVDVDLTVEEEKPHRMVRNIEKLRASVSLLNSRLEIMEGTLEKQATIIKNLEEALGNTKRVDSDEKNRKTKDEHPVLHASDSVLYPFVPKF